MDGYKWLYTGIEQGGYVLLLEIISLKELGIKAKGASRGRVAIWAIGGDVGGGMKGFS